jgi:hypothetical protein
MSNLGSDMVGREPMAFGDLVGSSLSPFDDQEIALMQPNVLGFEPRTPGSQPGQLSIQASVKELADLVAPGQQQKQQIPLVHNALLKRVPRLSMRRVRSMFHGEIDRLWDDERDALRREIADRKNSKARKAFAAAAAALVRGLSAAGHPLTADQTVALHDMVRTAA